MLNRYDKNLLNIRNNKMNYMINRLPSVFPTAMSGIAELFDEMDNMMSKPFVKKIFPYPVNIYNLEDKDGKVFCTNVEVALAGFTKDEISVKIRKGKTITLTLDPKPVEYNSETFRKDIFRGIAKRKAEIIWDLNPKIDCNNVKIKFENGILFINLPVLKETEEDNENIIEIK